ncbi:alpha/beta hydrolase [Novosphingobium sp. G106]|uniref:alpha/beta fold hydrolase n=1 Tax=Novosphingobium sp. G106 TaxID=2849500 RepID=UPI001C2D8475|nr:alpha/beta hydrolase [Novosphingobium sp. G106]MBV1688736.1 alpha/beta hydrolase [Novosphingobium sp. G106]
MSETATLEQDPAALVAEIETRARRVETPCGDGTMTWRIWGKGEPLVVGHGAQGAWSHWIRNIDALAKERMVIAVDMPGQGDSAVPATPDHAGISAALAAGLREILGPGKQADFAGFSFSGIAFAWFAHYHPEFVRRLILIGCGGLDTPHGHTDIQPVKGLVGEERKARLKANLLGLMLHHPDSVDELALHLLVENARNTRWVQVDMVIPDRLVAVLPKVTARVDAIWGEFDRPHPDHSVQEVVIRRSHPDCDFRVIAGAGHWAMYERPEAFNATLLDMLTN